MADSPDFGEEGGEEKDYVVTPPCHHTRKSMMMPVGPRPPSSVRDERHSEFAITLSFGCRRSRQKTLPQRGQALALLPAIEPGQGRSHQPTLPVAGDSLRLVTPSRRPQQRRQPGSHLRFTVDAVLTAAQRGSGKRASLYTDYTFSVWDDAGKLVSFAKAYSGLTDEEIGRVDAFVRRNMVE
jgi:hypothetical protein